MNDGNVVRCRICGTGVPDTGVHLQQQPVFECRTCGTYRLSERAAQRLYEITCPAVSTPSYFSNHHLISAALRERFQRTKHEVYVSTLDELVAAAHPLPGGFLESVDRLLLYVGDTLPRLGQPARLVASVDYPVAYARDGAELGAIVELSVDMGYLSSDTQSGDEFFLKPTAEGWRRLQQLRVQQPDRAQAFVAMWFDPEMDPTYLVGIEPALAATGYTAIRIDRLEHNDKIDDRIIAAIRQSGLVVADFTGNRGGVYFEAGFAMGLGRPVIWTCRADHMSGLHFDRRQYNHIVWETPGELRTRLEARITANAMDRREAR